MTIKEYVGPEYVVGRGPHKSIRNDWIYILWNKGFLDMKKYYWDRLTKKKKDLILNAEK